MFLHLHWIVGSLAMCSFVLRLAGEGIYAVLGCQLVHTVKGLADKARLGVSQIIPPLGFRCKFPMGGPASTLARDAHFGQGLSGSWQHAPG